MNSEWRRFLEQHGAHINEEVVADFGNATLELDTAANGATLCDLSHEGLIRVQGEDSQNFLQGQLTNDIRTVEQNTHQLSGYCSPKGRLLALFRVFMRHDEYYLQLPHALLDNTLKRLRMFVLRSKVTLDDVSDELVRFALSGKDAERLLGEQLAKLPNGDFATVTYNGITALRLSGPTPRFILHGENSAMQPLWLALQETGATPSGNAAWQWLQIQAGEPTVETETVEAFVPQMLNLQLINGVSFKKGCYTGQEVVARMQYLGKLKRRMYLAHSDSADQPHTGDELYSPASSSGQGAGRIVSLAQAPQGGYDMLAVLENSGVENGAFYLDEAQQRALTIHQPPYGFEPGDNELPQVTGQ